MFFNIKNLVIGLLSMGNGLASELPKTLCGILFLRRFGCGLVDGKLYVHVGERFERLTVEVDLAHGLHGDIAVGRRLEESYGKRYG